jgi:hypothetical protein
MRGPTFDLIAHRNLVAALSTMDVRRHIRRDLASNSVVQLPHSFAPPDQVEQGLQLRLKIVSMATVRLRLNYYSCHFQSPVGPSISAGMPLALNLRLQQAIWKDADATVWSNRLLCPATSIVESTHSRRVDRGVPVVTQGSDFCRRWHKGDRQPHIPHTRDAESLARMTPCSKPAATRICVGSRVISKASGPMGAPPVVAAILSGRCGSA